MEAEMNKNMIFASVLYTLAILFLKPILGFAADGIVLILNSINFSQTVYKITLFIFNYLGAIIIAFIAGIFIRAIVEGITKTETSIPVLIVPCIVAIYGVYRMYASGDDMMNIVKILVILGILFWCFGFRDTEGKENSTESSTK